MHHSFYDKQYLKRNNLSRKKYSIKSFSSAECDNINDLKMYIRIWKHEVKIRFFLRLEFTIYDCKEKKDLSFYGEIHNKYAPLQKNISYCVKTKTIRIKTIYIECNNIDWDNYASFYIKFTDPGWVKFIKIIKYFHVQNIIDEYKLTKQAYEKKLEVMNKYLKRYKTESDK